MSKYLKTLAILFIWVATSFCLMAHANSELNGSWKQSCFAGFQRTQHFKNEESSLIETYFSDSKCEKPFMEFKTFGRIQTQGSLIDFTFIYVGVRLLSADQVDKFNSQRVCGFGDWKINRLYNVSGRLCDLFLLKSPLKMPLENEQRYGIFKIELEPLTGDRFLYFGQGSLELDSTTPNKRPQTFQTKPYLFTL